jgi:hypothetical protein
MKIIMTENKFKRWNNYNFNMNKRLKQKFKSNRTSIKYDGYDNTIDLFIDYKLAEYEELVKEAFILLGIEKKRIT